MLLPNFWDSKKDSEATISQLNDLKNKIEKTKNLKNKIESNLEFLDSIKTDMDLEIKKLIERLEKENKIIPYNIFRATENVNLDMMRCYKTGGKKHNFLDTYDNEGE